MDFEIYNSGSDNGNQTLELQDALQSQLADKWYKMLFLVIQVPEIYEMAALFCTKSVKSRTDSKPSDNPRPRVPEQSNGRTASLLIRPRHRVYMYIGINT